MVPPVLLLLGLPESGTSVLADALVGAGARTPGPAGDPGAVSQFALAACGMRWDSMAAVPTRLPAAPGLDAARAAIDGLLERAGADGPLLIADPAATRIAALWRERIEKSGRPVAALLWITHPGSLAAVLARQRQFAPEKSLALWLAHTIEFERATRGLPRTVVAEDAFLADPAAGMKRIAQATRFPPAAAAAKSPLPPSATGDPPPLGLGSGLDTALDAGYRRLASTVSGDLKRTADGLATAARAALSSAVAPWLAQEIESDRARLQALADTAAARAARADRVTRELAKHCRENVQWIVGTTTDAALAGKLQLTVIATRQGPLSSNDSQESQRHAATATAVAAPKVSATARGDTEEGLGGELLRDDAPPRSGSGHAAPPPELTPQMRQAVMSRQSRGRRRKRNEEQQELGLFVVSRSRFADTQETVYNKQNLDEPTFLRRGMALN
ncbi:MAG: hypothetical protein J0L91_12150 [Burkholderiales bacterium]|nr:hypothetical protein [Burkholderiales bacterium]